MSAHHPVESKPRSIWPIFLVGLVLIGLFYVIAQYTLRSTPMPDPEAARAELRAKNLADLKKDNEQKLTQYTWMDKAAGTVRIPVKQAMELVIPTLNQTKPHAAYPVVAPAAPAAEASPAAATPATPAPAAPAASPAAAVPATATSAAKPSASPAAKPSSAP